MPTTIKGKFLCLILLAVAFVSPATAQTISTIAGVGSSASYLSGKTATAVSIYDPNAVIVDSSGNAYFSTNNQVYKFTTGGTLSLVAGTGFAGYSGDGAAATSAELNSPNGLALDSSGGLFIADTYNCVIREVNATTGSISTVAGTGSCDNATSDGLAATNTDLQYAMGLAVDRSDHLYIADTDNCVIRKVVNGTSTIVAGLAGNCDYSGDGDLATSARLDHPQSVAVDSSNNLYIADTLGNAILKVDASTGFISTVAGTHVYGYSGDGGAATSAELSDPTGVAVDSSKNLYIADSGNSVIRMVNASTGNISTVAGTGTSGYSGDGAAATSAELSDPAGVAVDSSGDLYIADYGSHTIREVNASTSTISTVAGNGYYSYSGDGGLATSAMMSLPLGSAIDSSGNLYFADSDNSLVRKIDVSTGVISTVAGNGVYGYSGDGAAATSAELGYPVGLTIDSSGNLYISDSQYSVVRKIDASTGVISTVAGNGSKGYSGDGTAATSAELSDPVGLTTDSSGNLYIADSDNCVVRKVDTSGTISTIAGSSSSCGNSGDGGAATSAELSSPSGLALDSSGNLLIADGRNGAIREVILDTSDTTNYGNITTVVGGGTGSITSGASATGVALSNPVGVYVDYAGAIFVADYDLDEVFKITGSSFASPASGMIAVVAGNGVNGYSGDGGLATSAELYYPTFLTGDLNGNLVISDSYNLVLRRVAGIVSTDPESVLSPTSLSFDSQTVGVGTTATKTVTLSNPGNHTLTVSSVAISGTNAADFTETDTCAGTTVAAASTCSINVTFATSVVGSESATLTITSSARTSPQTVSLSGTGIARTAGSSLSATSLSFNTQILGAGTRATQSVTLTNSGTAALTISSVAISGTNAADFTESNTCSTVVAGSTCTISVVFAATVAGSESATLTVTSNASSSPQKVALSGAGISFTAPTAASGGSTTSTISSGGTATYSLQLATTGGASTSDSLTFTLSCSGAPTGATCTVPSSVTVTPGTPGTFTVSVKTTKATTSAVRKSTLAKLHDPFTHGMSLALIPFGMIGLGLARKRRNLSGLFLLGLLTIAIFSTGCGSKSSSSSSTTTSGTTAGTYTLVIKATSGSVSKTTNLTLVVE